MSTHSVRKQTEMGSNWFKKISSLEAVWTFISVMVLSLIGLVIVLSMSNSRIVVEELYNFEAKNLTNVSTIKIPDCCISKCSYKLVVDNGPPQWSTINRLKEEEIREIAQYVAHQYSHDFYNNPAVIDPIIQAYEELHQSQANPEYQQAHYLHKILLQDLQVVQKIIHDKFGQDGNLYFDAGKLSEVEFNAKVRTVANKLSGLQSFHSDYVHHLQQIKANVYNLINLGINTVPVKERVADWNLVNARLLHDTVNNTERELMEMVKENRNIINQYGNQTPAYEMLYRVRVKIAEYFYRAALEINFKLQRHRELEKSKRNYPPTTPSNQQPIYPANNKPTEVSDKDPYAGASAPPVQSIFPNLQRFQK